MHRIDTANVASVVPTARPTGPVVGYFQNADPLNDVEPTKLDADWFNDVQENIARTIVDADGGNTALIKGEHTQLKEAIKMMIASGGDAPFLTGYMQGLLIRWAGASSITIDGGLCRDATDAQTIRVTSPLSVSLTTVGANGLDAGAEAPSTFYYPYVAMKADGSVCGLLSVSPTAPTLPTGYLYQRRLPGFFRNNAGGDLLTIQFFGWPYQPEFYYRDMQISGLSGDPTNVLSAGNATTYADVSLSAFLPPEVTRAYLYMSGARQSSVNYNFRRKGDASNGLWLVTRANMDTFEQFFWMDTNTSQQIQYKVDDASASVGITVAGGRMP